MPNSVCSFGAIKYIAVSMEMHQKLDELQLTGVCVCVLNHWMDNNIIYFVRIWYAHDGGLANSIKTEFS